MTLKIHLKKIFLSLPGNLLEVFRKVLNLSDDLTTCRKPKKSRQKITKEISQKFKVIFTWYLNRFFPNIFGWILFVSSSKYSCYMFKYFYFIFYCWRDGGSLRDFFKNTLKSDTEELWLIYRHFSGVLQFKSCKKNLFKIIFHKFRGLVSLT